MCVYVCVCVCVCAWVAKVFSLVRDGRKRQDREREREKEQGRVDGMRARPPRLLSLCTFQFFHFFPFPQPSVFHYSASLRLLRPVPSPLSSSPTPSHGSEILPTSHKQLREAGDRKLNNCATSPGLAVSARHFSRLWSYKAQPGLIGPLMEGWV